MLPLPSIFFLHIFFTLKPHHPLQHLFAVFFQNKSLSIQGFRDLGAFPAPKNFCKENPALCCLQQNLSRPNITSSLAGQKI